MTQTKQQDISLLNSFLNTVERVGNKLPHPIALFFIMAILTVLLSGLLSTLGISAVGDLINKTTGKIETQTITVISLLNAKGIIYKDVYRPYDECFRKYRGCVFNSLFIASVRTCKFGMDKSR